MTDNLQGQSTHLLARSPCRVSYCDANRDQNGQASAGWKRVSVDGNDVYIPQNKPVKALKTQNQKIAFGQVAEALGMVEKIAGAIEDEKAGSRSGKRSSDIDGTTPTKPPNPCYRVAWLSRRHARAMIELASISRAQEVRITHLGRANAIQSTWWLQYRIGRLKDLAAERKSQGERQREFKGYE